mgnify:CR=1 FL=1
MPKTSAQRIKVWRGELAQTTGGLTKAMLTKNKRGKIVSRKKSRQAASSNNLGTWLHDSGVAIPKAKILRYKSSPPEGAKQAKEPKKAPKKAAPKPKPKPKKVAAKPKKVAKKKKKANINPLTDEPYKQKSGPGMAAGADIDPDNIILPGQQDLFDFDAFADF